MTDWKKAATENLELTQVNYRYLKATSDEMFLNMLMFHMQQTAICLMRQAIPIDLQKSKNLETFDATLEAAIEANVEIPDLIKTSDLLRIKWSLEEVHYVDFYGSIKKIDHLLEAMQQWMNKTTT